MTPQEARDWISGLEILGMRFGLERMTALLAALDHPQSGAPALHVVGTNGKSSTARLAAGALMGHGCRVGTYLSPHVTDWAERIQIQGAPIDADGFAAAASAVRAAAEALVLADGDGVTQFEALTAMAFCAFRAAAVDAAVVEAGLGGRYDATNVLSPGAVVILTNIALEHTDLLGETEAEIAAEKLAVCRDGSSRLVIGRLSAAGRAAVDGECERRDLRPVRYGEGLLSTQGEEGVGVITPRCSYGGIALDVAGDFQRDNLAVAIAGAEMVIHSCFDEPSLRAAIASVRVPGRLEMFPGSPPVVLDGAHNPAGMEAMVASLPGVVGDRRPVVAVLSLLSDKDADGMVAPLVPAVDRIVATRSSHARAVPAETLAALASRHGCLSEHVDDPHEALLAARVAAGPGGVVIVAGSLYLLADLRPGLASGDADPPGRLARARQGRQSPEAE